MKKIEKKIELIRQGKYVGLPIVDHTVSEIHFKQYALPTLIFTEDWLSSASLRLDSVILTVSRGTQEQVFHSSQKPFDPNELKNLMELLGSVVTKAQAAPSGSLLLEFSNKITLTINPDVWEGWFFNYGSLSLIGDDGRLITF